MPEDKPDFSRADLKRIVKPDLKAIGEAMTPDLIKALVGTGSIFPDADYWKRFGIHSDEDGYVTAPNGWRMPTAETYACQEIKKATEVDELERLYSRKPE